MEKLRVLKFGGSSVGSPEKIRKVASIIHAEKLECQNIVVVVSAMGDTTDELLTLARAVTVHADSPSYRRELDMLLSAGERISMSLLSMALSDLGLKCRSLTGSQSGIITDTSHGEARIDQIKAIRIEECLKRQEIVIVAGFQGVSHEKEITTLGRGGSDTSAVALGVALKADDIYIYTDVSGFMSADPRIVPAAFVYDSLDATLAYLGASRGAQVLHPRCLEIAAKNNLPIWIKNTFAPHHKGTCIKEMNMSKLEGPQIKSISQQKDLGLISFKAPSTRVLRVLFDVGMRPQDIEWREGELRFILQQKQLPSAKELLKDFQLKVQLCSNICLTGFGFENHPELVTNVLELFDGDPLLCYRTSPISLNLVLDADFSPEERIRSLHSKFISK